MLQIIYKFVRNAITTDGQGWKRVVETKYALTTRGAMVTTQREKHYEYSELLCGAVPSMSTWRRFRAETHKRRPLRPPGCLRNSRHPWLPSFSKPRVVGRLEKGRVTRSACLYAGVGHRTEWGDSGSDGRPRAELLVSWCKPSRTSPGRAIASAYSCSMKAATCRIAVYLGCMLAIGAASNTNRATAGMTCRLGSPLCTEYGVHCIKLWW